MKTLHTYLTRQVLASLLMTVTVFTFVLLLVTVIKEMLALLVSGQASPGLVAEAIGLLIPFVLVFALPMGLLTATLLVFGRFSADQELTAVRASGISLVSLVTPVLLLSLTLCGVSAVVNLWIGPQCRVAYRELLFAFKARAVGSYLPEGRFVKDIPGCIFYVRKSDGENLKDVMVYMLEGGTNVAMKIRAPTGNYSVDVASKKLELHLYNATSVSLVNGKWITQFYGEWTPDPFNLNPTARTDRRPDIRDMTFTQLREELAELENNIGGSNSMRTGAETSSDKNREARKQRKDLTEPVRVQIHERVAFSFACFSFALVGIPLGIRVHRRETNIGIAMALILVIIYYSLMIFAEPLATPLKCSPILIVWLPNFIFQAVGAVLLWRANRGV